MQARRRLRATFGIGANLLGRWCRDANVDAEGTARHPFVAQIIKVQVLNAGRLVRAPEEPAGGNRLHWNIPHSGVGLSSYF
jgi:hypothetical protein